MTTDANRFRREAYSFSLLTVDNLRRLNAESKTVEVQSRSKIDDIIDKQTNDYLASLDKKTRSQLSKTQLVKSHQKVYAWKKKNRSENAKHKNIILILAAIILVPRILLQI